ncbi:MAG: glycosyltransferase family 9 protein, partial [Gammaproteobacteria bacterium]|nr:glycosyltransferase family 9 protein [Gammaproteobacteria bacterium]
MLSFSTPPAHICILRLSAIGDICHTLPVIRNIQSQWPETKITWIIGQAEYHLLKGTPGIHFIIFDKKNGFKEYLHVYNQLKNIRFDLLLHMQMSLRASLISLLVNTKIKVGFDRQRAKDGQWIFTNHKIAYSPQQHVMDSLFAFSDYIGIKRAELTWDIPVSNEEHASANALLAGHSRYVIISPCSSKDYRNWNVKGYAKVADYIKEKYHCDVILTGGN